MARELLVVGDANDGLSAEIEREGSQRGISTTHVDLERCGRQFTVRVDGCAGTVVPSCAILLRPVKPPPSPSSADERFVWAELFATLWSAAALTDAPVVNRPGVHGLASTVALSAVITERRCGRDIASSELLWRLLPPADTGGWLHQDLTTWAVVDDASIVELGRSRRLPPMRGWEQVIVVGEDALRVTTADLGVDIERDSVELAKSLELTFLSVSWGVPADGSRPIMTRVNAFPTLHECLPVLDFTCDRLLRVLCP